MHSVERRFYVDLPESTQKGVRFFLRQTTMLWNCLVAHIGQDVLEITRSHQDSEQTMTFIKDMVNSAYRILILGEDLGISFTMAPHWKRQIKYIRKLPRDVMDNRVNDLIDTYCYAHKKHVEGEEYPYFPRLKECGSTETMRFNPCSWENKGNEVTLKLKGGPLTITIPGFDKVEPGMYQLTFTKKRPARTREAICTNGVKETSLYVTLSVR